MNGIKDNKILKNKIKAKKKYLYFIIFGIENGFLTDSYLSIAINNIAIEDKINENVNKVPRIEQLKLSLQISSFNK